MLWEAKASRRVIEREITTLRKFLLFKLAIYSFWLAISIRAEIHSVRRIRRDLMWSRLNLQIERVPPTRGT